MTTYQNDENPENRSKKTDPLPDRRNMPPEEETPQETGDSNDDPLQELRQHLHSEDRPHDSSKSDIFARMTGSISNRKAPQQPKEENGSDHVFGVRTAGNTPFEQTDRQLPDTDSTKNTVILQNAPKSEPFIQSRPQTSQSDSGHDQDESNNVEGEEDLSYSDGSRVRPLDPNEQDAAWHNYSTEQSTDQKTPVSLLDEKIAQTQGERKRLKSGFDRQQQVSRYISYNPKRSTRDQFKELSKVEKTLIIALASAVLGLVILIAYLFIMSRQPGFGAGNSLVATQTPVPTVSPPVPAKINLTGGWSFELGIGIMVDGEWNPRTSEWLVDSEVRRVIAIPWNVQVEAVVQTFEPGDLLELEMSNGDSFAYKVLTVSEIPVDDTSILYDVRPTLAIILMKPEAEKHWVVVAEPQ